jgi:large subunit ribosomal protein L22
MGYQMAKPEGKVARAYGYELRTSWKNAINVTREIQGLNVRKAEAFLEDVIALRRPVRFTTRNRKVAAKPGIGKGRYPKKSTQATLAVLRNAINNAEYQGHDADNMVILHASAYKGRTLKGFMPRAHGRASPKNEETCNIEIILVEHAEEEAESKPTKAKKSEPTGAEPKKAAEKKPAEKNAEAKHEHKPGEKHDHKAEPKKTQEAKT